MADATFTNPVVASNAPDPGVARFGSLWYMVSTGMTDSGGAFTLRTSPDLMTWTLAGSVFSAESLPSWADINSEIFWAPEIHGVAGRYHVYFVANDTRKGKCTGVATADAPSGPYSDSGAPLVCSVQVGTRAAGAIDPNFFKDSDGQQYLLWKDEGPPTNIRLRKLDESGLAFASGSKEMTLIKNDAPWENWQVEGPWLFRHNGEYFLFYSGGKGTWDPTYAVGVARASSIEGPYAKACAPVLTQVATLERVNKYHGPGHCSVVETDTGTAMLFHVTHGKDKSFRPSFVERVWWDSHGWPTVGTCNTPSEKVQPSLHLQAKAPECLRLEESYLMKTSQESGVEWKDDGTLSTHGSVFKVRMSPFCPGGTVSFEAAGKPGSFLSDVEGRLHLRECAASPTASCIHNSSFMATPGILNMSTSSVALRPIDNPWKFVRARDGLLVVDDYTASTEFAKDASFFAELAVVSV
eukprot:TRINITY_DN1482_c1_g1_i1.p1 TRINITY_DN1482_c1_g1~~TRINITY_DN1482_c1_g1_i1.p1  ORF type:complete len:506 (-),score=53.86 TRINITY_DN1482_c1_g1_i1:41-1441(-)